MIYCYALEYAPKKSKTLLQSSGRRLKTELGTQLSRAREMKVSGTRPRDSQQCVRLRDDYIQPLRSI